LAEASVTRSPGTTRWELVHSSCASKVLSDHATRAVAARVGPRSIPDNTAQRADGTQFERHDSGQARSVLAVFVLGIAVIVRDALGVLVFLAFFAILVSSSERTAPRWLRRRGYPPPLYLQTKEGRERLRRLMRERPRRNTHDDPPR
jgi:hypothetical protein